MLLIFPVGFLFSFKLYDNYLYYLILTILNFLSGFFILFSLKKFNFKYIHLWVIFIIFIFAYFVKYYILVYLFLNINEYFEYLDIYFPIETEYFRKPELVLNYYQDITIFLLSFSLYINLFINKVGKAQILENLSFNFSTIKLSLLKLKIFFGFTIILWVIFLNIQLELKLGFVSLDQEFSTNLPYHLAGMIMTVINFIIPFLFLVVLFFSTVSRYKSLIWVTTITYIIYGMINGIVTTSKAPVYTVFISLLIIWILTNNFNRKKFLVAMIVLPFLSLFSMLLSTYRVIRNFNPDLTVSGIVYKFYSSFQSNNFDDLTNGGTSGALLSTTQKIGTFMRLNGADSYLNIMHFNPQFSIERIIHLLFSEQRAIYVLYSEDVLGLPSTSGLAFSPSLLGFLKFILGDTILVCIGMFFYVLFWHFVFYFVRKLHFKIEPIIISMLVILLAKYTSEGTLESMPKEIFSILCLSFIFEKFFRFYFKNNIQLINK